MALDPFKDRVGRSGGRQKFGGRDAHQSNQVLTTGQTLETGNHWRLRHAYKDGGHGSLEPVQIPAEQGGPSLISQLFPHLFSPLKIGPVELRNRTVFTGHATNLSTDGHPNDALVAYQRARVAGGAGLIVTQVSCVHPTGWHSGLSLKVFDDECITHYRRVADAVHQFDCRLFGQLFHPGREGHMSDDGLQPAGYAPSAFPADRFHVMPRAMSTAFVEEIVSVFGDGARRMQEAGYDGVEIMDTQGYLVV